MIRRDLFLLRVSFVFVAIVLLIRSAAALDAPVPVRAFHFSLLGISTSEAKQLVDQAAAQHFNTIILNVPWGAGVELESFPWAVKTKPWKKSELVDFVQYVRGKRMDVVPQMHTLSHQRVLLNKHRPDLSFNKSTYDPSKPEVYKIVLPMLDELIELVRPKAVHIGHDEIVGWKKSHFGKFIDVGGKALPAELFLKDVLTLNEHLKKKGIKTWMWGDMLISPDEFPSMQKDQLHGHLVGYGKPLRDRIPRDIVICDWHYLDDQSDFPSLKAFHDEGFVVLGATWDKTRTTQNFSKYAAENRAYGMIATTWSYVQKKEWDEVEKIIRESGKAFGKDFPYAK